MTLKTTVIINDCRDANAAARQIARAQALLHCPVSFIGVVNDLEAGGNLIDTLDAIQDENAFVLVNVAPRHGHAKQWENGTPFCYFRYRNTLVIASVDGLTLSLVKKLRLVEAVNVLDIPTCLDIMDHDATLGPELKHNIINTQFRSYEFLPRVAAYLQTHRDIQSDVLAIDAISDAPDAVWWVDNFGNCKTTLLFSDLTPNVREKHALRYYDRLKDVPDKEIAFITGSSGLSNDRFLEICRQGSSAAEKLAFVSGSVL
jgi:hypothetical protein